MANSSWILAALVAALLICDAAAIQCVSCTSSTSGTCGQGTDPVQTCSAADDKCYYWVDEGVVLRGCFSALSQQDQSKCLADPSGCLACTTDGCNKEPWAKCYSCDSSDPSCTNEQTDATKATFCKKFSAGDKCYAKADGTKVVRGCLSDLPSVNDGCTGNRQCEFCTGDACNKQSLQALTTFQKCHICTSQDPKCLDGTTTPLECNPLHDVCYSRVQNNQLERGCLSTLSSADQTKCKSDQDSTCVTCNDAEGCNKQTWLKCHQCKQADTATCADAQTDDKAGFCKAYKVDNECYERLEGDSVVRGCGNDLTVSAADICKDNLECRKCATSGCNKEAASTLKTKDRCLQCSSSADADSSCLLGTAPSQPCRKESSEKCFSRTKEDGVLERGCQSDLTTQEVTACTGSTCNVCDKEGCNKGVFPTDRLRCYQCTKTDADKSCADQLTGDPKSAYCKVYKKDDQCYTRIVKDVFERGCQSSLNVANACEGLDDKHCQRCTGENCNALSEAKLNSAGRTAISALLVVVGAIVVALR